MADLAQKTKEEIFELMRRAAEELYPDADWTGLRTGSFEWLMSKLVAEVSELNGYYLDRRADNAYISSTNIRRDIRNIAQNIGLTIRERAGASVSLDIVASSDTTIPIGSRFVSSNGAVFSTLSELVLESSGSLSGSVNAIHADYDLVTYRSRGDANETVRLGKTDVLPDNTTLTVDGVTWEQVSDFSGTTSASEVYVISFDEFNRVSIKFGNGVYGERLPADSQVNIHVFSGGGTAGNSVGAASITVTLDTWSGSTDVTSINNAIAPSGGRGADSLDSIRAQLPAQIRQVAGIINKTDATGVLKRNLNWLSDAAIEPGHTTINGVYVPTSKVSAYPASDSIVGMSVAQATELSSFLSTRGELGVQWSTQDAYQAPLEMEIEVRIDNKNLESQKEADIKAALVDGSAAPFVFSNLGFNSVFTRRDILTTITNVEGVSYAKLNKFGRIPQSLVINGTTGTDVIAGSDAAMVDIELGSVAADGYMQFNADSTSTAASHFFKPIKIDTIGSDWVKSSEVNWLVEEFDFVDGDALDDTAGPWVKPDSGPLSFKQLENVWSNDEFNGSTYLDDHLLRVQWVDASDVTKTAYYHITDTILPGTITTVEDADSPISGDAISATLANTNYSRINIQIIKDQTAGGMGSLHTPQGGLFDITHNNKNTLYLGSAPAGSIPVNQDSFIHFDEAQLDTSTDGWVSNSGALQMRLYISTELSVGDIIEVYMTPTVADRLEYKHFKEVFILSKSNITIRFI